jgi:hypothetical protein
MIGFWYAHGPIVSDVRGNRIAKIGDGARAGFVNEQIAARIASLPRLQRAAKQALDILEESVPLGSSDVRLELAAALEAIK